MAVTPRPIDVLQLGQQRAICCWQVGELLVDPGPASTLETVLGALDVEPRVVLLTHIHLDHAASAGTLARRFPGLKVFVHERGARHMLDPSKLLASATRIYGEHMDMLWGTFEAVPADQLTVLSGGERLDFGECGRYEVLYTPGHAVHHVSYISEDGDAFVGDVAGTRVPGSAVVLPPTPPPDIHPPDWQASLAALAERAPARLLYTHFGETDEVSAHLAQLSERVDHWAERARDYDLAAWTELTRAEMIEVGAGQGEVDYQLGPGAAEANYGGLRRYWDKRAAEATSAV
ncbi:MAG TPA: MBL fold metallo-hydrolase [Solirubrobacteraceae bacterium]|nr:MBL fold metallo-hydrolase [Solirubrobacteraceae bacterium]